MEMFKDNETMSKNLGDLVWLLLPTMVTVPPLGLPTNALVIRLLLGKPGICSNSEIFTLNQALLNMLFCFLLPAEYIRFLFSQTIEAANFLAWGLNQVGGPMLLCMLSLDSYMAVCHPLVFLQLKDPKLRLSLCLVVSFITAACCCLVKLSNVFKRNMMFGLLGITIVSITTCNILILKSLRQSGPNRKAVHPMKKRAFKIVLIAFALVNFHYLPPLSEYLLKKWGPRHFRPFSVVTSFTYFVSSMSSVLQPLSYLTRTKQLPKMRCHHGSVAEAKTVATD